MKKLFSELKIFIKDVLWLGHINKFLYGPKKIIKFEDFKARTNEIKIHEVIPQVKSSLYIENDLLEASNTPAIKNYKSEIILNPTLIAEIKNGRLMTDGTDIAIMTYDRLLLEHFSVHYNSAVEMFSGSKTQELNNMFKQKYYYPPKYIKGTVLNMQTGGGGNNYWHFLTDMLPGYYLAEKSGLINEIDYFYFQSIEKNFHKEILKALNIDLKKVITNKDTLHFKADRLISFTHPNVRFHLPIWIIEFLRETFLKMITPDKDQFSKIYLSRKDAPVGRYVINEDEIFAKLEPLGFKRIILSEYSFLDQVKIFNSANIVISPQGTTLTGLIFCNPKTNVVEIYSEEFIIPDLRCISSHLNLNYNYFITKCISGSSVNYGYSNMYIDEAKLLLLLEKIVNNQFLN